ncbi:hypothetical protein Syun_021127 [Stephania yunnanensis]|uniref:Secreted protein n=1 Tax=Stephania yunnanensis TaxID=152371 RepID=A0AAP0IFT5_9MAGN
MATTSARVLQCRPHLRVLLLHLRVASAVFADSLKEQGQNQSPLRRFADSSSSSDSSSPIRDLSAEEDIATAATLHRLRFLLLHLLH